MAIAQGDSGITTIKNIQIVSDLFVWVEGTSAFANPDSCSSSNGIVIRKTDPWYKEALAAVMLAKATDKPIRFWLTGCFQTPWSILAPIAYSVTIDPQ